MSLTRRRIGLSAVILAHSVRLIPALTSCNEKRYVAIVSLI